MAEYGFFIPSAGRTLIAGLLAGETLEISRVMVGSGKPQSQEDLASLTGGDGGGVPVRPERRPGHRLLAE